MLVVIAPSFLTQSPSCEANLPSLLIRRGSAVTTNLGAHEHGAEDNMLGASPACPRACDQCKTSVTFQLININATNCSWQGNWAENHPKQNRNQQLRRIGETNRGLGQLFAESIIHIPWKVHFKRTSFGRRREGNVIGSIFGTLIFKRGKIILYIFSVRRSFFSFLFFKPDCSLLIHYKIFVWNILLSINLCSPTASKSCL